MHAGKGDKEQSCDFEYGRTEIYHSVVLSYSAKEKYLNSTRNCRACLWLLCREFDYICACVPPTLPPPLSLPLSLPPSLPPSISTSPFVELYASACVSALSYSTSLMPLSKRMIFRIRRILMTRSTRLVPLSGTSVSPLFAHSWK